MGERNETANTKKVSDKDFFFAYLPECLDEQAPKDVLQKFQTLISEPEYQTAAQIFKTQRDILQLQLRSLALNDDNFHTLRTKARSDELEGAIEGAEIKALKLQEAPKAQLQRWSAAAILLTLCTAFLYTYYAKNEMGFDPVQALPYEAIEMEDDPELTRLDLPSTSIEEIESFFAKHTGLKFTPFVLRNPSWQPLGSSIIDYDVAKIAVTRFASTSNNKDSLFQFVFSGRLKELSPSTPGRLNNLVYQTYASDRHNLIVWQQDAHTLGMLVGHLKAEDLAQLALSGSPQRMFLK